MTDEITPAELKAELNEVHGRGADEAEVRSALSSLKNESSDDEDDGDDASADSTVLRCKSCGEYIKRADVAAHYAECDE